MKGDILCFPGGGSSRRNRGGGGGGGGGRGLTASRPARDCI